MKRPGRYRLRVVYGHGLPDQVVDESILEAAKRHGGVIIGRGWWPDGGEREIVFRFPTIEQRNEAKAAIAEESPRPVTFREFDVEEGGP